MKSFLTPLHPSLIHLGEGFFINKASLTTLPSQKTPNKSGISFLMTPNVLIFCYSYRLLRSRKVYSIIDIETTGGAGRQDKTAIFKPISERRPSPK